MQKKCMKLCGAVLCKVCIYLYYALIFTLLLAAREVAHQSDYRNESTFVVFLGDLEERQGVVQQYFLPNLAKSFSSKTIQYIGGKNKKTKENIF